MDAATYEAWSGITLTSDLTPGTGAPRTTAREHRARRASCRVLFMLRVRLVANVPVEQCMIYVQRDNRAVFMRMVSAYLPRASRRAREIPVQMFEQRFAT